MARLFVPSAAAVLVAFFAAMLSSVAVEPAKAETRVEVSFFYDELEPYGYWVDHPVYGTVWYPRHQPADWYPYAYGRWVWTADYGWYWDSDEDWGWATYHYGRWVYTAAYGWVWVPDDEWGPAWVEWRTGGGYVGWTPMPPEVAWRGDAFVYADVDMSGPRYRPRWFFVAEASFTKSDPWRYRAPPRRNAELLRASVRTTNYRVVNARVVNRSVDVRRISAAADVRIAPTDVVFADGPAHVRTRARGRVSVYRPDIRARAKVRVHTPPVSARVGTEVDADVPPPIDVDSHGRGSVGVSRGLDAGIGVGGGIGGGGIGIGGGGGLRIGR